MRFLVIADIHANWHALEAVLADAEGQYEQVICCGDLVGYNPNPDRVTEWVRGHSQSVVRGNHDKVVAGLEKLSWFNEVAQEAARWTIQTMAPENIEYLRAMPTGPSACSDFSICHGSPTDEDEYITNPGEAMTCFASLTEKLVFFGHSHLQGGFLYKRSRAHVIPAVKRRDTETIVPLDIDTQYLINPGSVGQPRDGDPRAAYALYESEQRVVTLRRIPYAIKKTIEEIEQAALPDVLGKRLLHGI